jgi:enterochelin esterase-like enzyme/outer membrane protein assembly factor BamB
MSRIALRVLIALAVAGGPPLAGAADWSHWRGPTQDGRAPGAGLFPEGFGLETVWKAPLGPAYSGVVVSGGRVVTMYSDGQSDHVVALDAATGKELWRHRLGGTYKGHDGSDDGPLSTPLVHGGIVHALGPKGRLVALRLDDGGEVWSLDVKERFAGREPEYGFTTTPLVEGDLLIVEPGGGKGRSVVGLDRGTGKTVWTATDHWVEYQSPSVLTLAGRRQLLAVDQEDVAGIDPASGQVLWTYEHRGTGASTSPHVVPLGGDRFLLKFWTNVAVFEVRRSGEGFEASKLYEADVFSKSYLPPVLHEGHLYGFTSEFLTCVDAATGERVWRSRPPGGKGLLLVDGHLAILGTGGVVVVAEATPEGYREKARVQALERSDYAWPAFADGKIFVRDLSGIAAVAITGSAAREAARPPAGLADTGFHAFLLRAAASGNPRSAVDEYLARQTSFPIVEGAFAHFVYRGEAEDVAVQGTMLDDDVADSLQRLEGTDLFHRSYELDRDARYEYRFQIDFEGHVTDPRNPEKVPDPWEGHLSVLRMPDYSPPPSPGAAGEERRGRLETLPHASKILGNRRKLEVYLPAGYDEGGARYPVLYVSEGREWIDHGRMVDVLDDRIGRTVAPLIVVFVEKAERDAWNELGQKRSASYAQMLAEEIVPKIDSRYRTVDGPQGRVLMGATDAGRVSVHAALLYPRVFGGVAVRTMSLAGTGSDVLALLAQTKPAALKLYLDWNRHESRSSERRFDRRADSERFARLLERLGLAWTGGERADSHGWGSRRAGTPPMLEALFPRRS